MSEPKKLTYCLGESKASYCESDRIIHYHTNGVHIQCKVPENWTPTRVLQFMQELLEARLS